MDNLSIEQFAVGDEKVSITITRKTKGDLVVAQFSAERWFDAESSAADAVQRALTIFVETSLGSQEDTLRAEDAAFGHQWSEK